MREREKRASAGERSSTCVHQGRQAGRVAWDFTVAGSGTGTITIVVVFFFA